MKAVIIEKFLSDKASVYVNPRETRGSAAAVSRSVAAIAFCTILPAGGITSFLNSSTAIAENKDINTVNHTGSPRIAPTISAT